MAAYAREKEAAAKQAAMDADPIPRKRFRAEDVEHLLNLQVDLDDDDLMAEGDTTS